MQVQLHPLFLCGIPPPLRCLRRGNGGGAELHLVGIAVDAQLPLYRNPHALFDLLDHGVGLTVLHELRHHKGIGVVGDIEIDNPRLALGQLPVLHMEDFPAHRHKAHVQRHVLHGNGLAVDTLAVDQITLQHRSRRAAALPALLRRRLRRGHMAHRLSPQRLRLGKDILRLLKIRLRLRRGVLRQRRPLLLRLLGLFRRGKTDMKLLHTVAACQHCGKGIDAGSVRYSAGKVRLQLTAAPGALDADISHRTALCKLGEVAGGAALAEQLQQGDRGWKRHNRSPCSLHSSMGHYITFQNIRKAREILTDAGFPPLFKGSPLTVEEKKDTMRRTYAESRGSACRFSSGRHLKRRIYIACLMCARLF